MTAVADSHLHLFRGGFPGRYGRVPDGHGGEIEAYERYRAEHEIEAGLIVGYEGNGIEPHNNRYIRHLAETRPWMATLAYIEPEAEFDRSAAMKVAAEGHVGIAVYLRSVDAAGLLFDWESAWKQLNEHRAIVSFNAPPEAAARLAPIVAANDRCTFLFSHLGLPGRYAAVPSPDAASSRLAPLLSLAELPNAVVKISGLYSVSDPPHDYPHNAAAPFIEILLDRFGVERCCWGSDFSPSLDFVSFAQTLSIASIENLTTSDRSLVMGENLLRLLGR